MTDYLSEIVDILFVLGECQVNYHEAFEFIRMVIPKKNNIHVTNHSIIWDFEQRVWQGH